MSKFEISPLEDGSGLKLSGELDLAAAPRLREAFLMAPQTDGIILDLSELVFVDSSGLSAIFAHARSRNGNGPVVLVDPPASVARVLELVHLEAHPGIEVRYSD